MLAILQKEWMETLRCGRLLNTIILFMVFGIMSPAIAKLTPWMMEMMAEEMAETGLIVTAVEIDALTCWTQFFKNIPLALLAFIVLYGSILTDEFQRGTLTLLMTRGFPRWKIIAAKMCTLITGWTTGYWMCFTITYGYSAYYWDNSIAKGLAEAAVYWWIFGLWTLALLTLFSVICEKNSGALIGTGIIVAIAYIISLLPKTDAYSPAILTGGMVFVDSGAEVPIAALVITLILTMISIAAAVLIMNRK